MAMAMAITTSITLNRYTPAKNYQKGCQVIEISLTCQCVAYLSLAAA
jgi:hypothetical protein